jgi:hypothetical protein
MEEVEQKDKLEISEHDELSYCVYVTELYNQAVCKVTKKTETCFIIEHLEKEFYKNPDGFHMFYEPHPEQPDYRQEGSWIEVLVFTTTVNDFKLNFDQIGVRYSSYKEYAEAADKFGNKYYCSYYDKDTKRIYYIRNNEVVERHIKSVLNGLTIVTLENSRQKAIVKSWEQVKLNAEKTQGTGQSSSEKLKLFKEFFDSSEYMGLINLALNIENQKLSTSGI